MNYRGKGKGGRRFILSGYGRLETYLIPGETLIPGGKGGKRFTLVLDMLHI